MDEKVGMANLAQRAPAYLPGQSLQLQRDCSEQTAREIDEEVKKLLDNCYTEAKDILSAHRTDLRRVVLELLKRETLEGETLYQLIGKTMPEGPGSMREEAGAVPSIAAN